VKEDKECEKKENTVCVTKGISLHPQFYQGGGRVPSVGLWRQNELRPGAFYCGFHMSIV